VDGFSATLTKFRRELTTTSGAIRAMKMADLPAPDANFERAGQQVLRFERTATQAATALRGLPGLGTLGGIGSIAGIAAMAQNFATGNISLRATAQMAGTTASGLNGLRGAAVLTGVSANTADQAMLGLNRTLGEAAFGRNMQAANVMRNLGIDFGSAATGARRASDVFPEVVQQVQRLAQTDPRAAARLLDILGMPGDILPLAMRGAEGIAELTRQAERLRPVTDANRQAADNYTLAMGRLELGATGLRDKLVTDLEPAFTSVMGRMTELIGRNKEAETSFGSLAKSALDAIRQAGIESGAADLAAKTGLTAFARQHVPWMGRDYPDEAPSEARWRNYSRAPRRPEDDPDWRQDVYDQLPGSGQFLYRHLQGSRGNYNANTPTGLSRYYNQATPGENLRAGLSSAGPVGPITPGSTALPNAPADKAAFVQRFGGAAQIMAQQTGTAAPFWLGQWAQESGWGRAMAGNNPGNIKAGGSWTGATVRQADGLLYRAYPTMEEGARDQAALVRNSTRYRDVLNRGNDMEGASRALGSSGYAEDPSYGAHVLARVRALGPVPTVPSPPPPSRGPETRPEEPDLTRGGRLPNSSASTVPTPIASPEGPDLTRGGRLPSLATPGAPRQPVVSDQSGSTVRIHLSADNLPQGMNIKTGVEGNGAEIARLNIRRAMPGAGS